MKLPSGVVILVIAASLGGALSWFALRGEPAATPLPSPTPVQGEATPVLPTPTDGVTAALPTTVLPTQTPPAVDPAAGLVSAMNVERSAHGAGALVRDSALDALAHAHAQDMAQRGFFSHTSLDGVTFAMRMDASGYGHAGAAENIGVASAWIEIVPDWMASSGHRENLLNATYRRVGAAVASGTYQGRAAVYAVAVFVAPE